MHDVVLHAVSITRRFSLRYDERGQPRATLQALATSALPPERFPPRHGIVFAEREEASSTLQEAGSAAIADRRCCQCSCHRHRGRCFERHAQYLSLHDTCESGKLIEFKSTAFLTMAACFTYSHPFTQAPPRPVFTRQLVFSDHVGAHFAASLR